MVKKFFVVFAVTFLIMAGGCGLPDPKPNPQELTKEEPAPEVDNTPEVKGENQQKDKQEYYIGLSAPVEGLRDWVDRYKMYEGVFQQAIGSKRVLLVTLGEKFIPGYSLRVEEVTQEGDKWLVEVAYSEDEPPDNPSGALAQETYVPLEVITFPDDGKAIEVARVRDGKAVEDLDITIIPEGEVLPSSKSFIVFEPLSGEGVASPIHIKGKARVFEANFRITVKEGTNHLATQVVMADEGAPGWGNFNLELPIRKPVTSDVMIVFAYENMENGELIEELAIPVKVQ